jgi:hypothetical protein
MASLTHEPEPEPEPAQAPGPEPEPEPGPGSASAPSAGPGAQRLLGDFWGTSALCLAGAGFGLWFTPFALGVAVTAFRPRSRAVVLTVTAGAVAGWALALWLMALASLPVGATAKSIAAVAGLPPYAAVAIAVTLLLAAVQALAGSWLARAVFPRRLRLPFPRRGRGQPGGTAHPADPQP